MKKTSLITIVSLALFFLLSVSTAQAGVRYKMSQEFCKNDNGCESYRWVPDDSIDYEPFGGYCDVTGIAGGQACSAYTESEFTKLTCGKAPCLTSGICVSNPNRINEQERGICKLERCTTDKDGDGSAYCPTAVLLNSNGLYVASDVGDCDDNNPKVQDSYKVSVADIQTAKVYFDPSYVNEMRTTRAFTPSLPPSVMDDINIGVTFKESGRCNVQWEASEDAKVEVMVGSKSVGSFPLETRYFINTEGKNELGIRIGKVFKKVTELEKVIDSIYPTGNLTFRLKSKDPYTKRPVQKDVAVKMTDCARTYGNGDIGIVTMRGKSAGFSAIDPFGRSAMVVDAFNKIEPLKTYTNRFRFYADLRQHNDTTWPMISIGGVSIFRQTPELKTLSSCKAGNKYELLTGRLSGLGGYVIAKSANNIFVKPSEGVSTDIHELGHAVAGLSDEYMKQLGNRSLFQKILFPNSWFAPNCQKEKGGDFNFSVPGCTFGEFLKTTSSSIMNGSSGNFNLLSCSYWLKAIKGGSVKSHIAECSAMAGIIKS